jgi:GAG-pre-integrase domain/Integrase core domain
VAGLSTPNPLYYFWGVTASLVKDNTLEVKNKILLWHKWLGHPSFGYMENLSPHLFSNWNKEELLCETCVNTKSHQTSYNDSLSRNIYSFDLIHTDVWGPSPILSKSGYKWFILFIDDHSRMTWLYLLKSKDEVPKVVKDFHNLIKTQFGKGIKIIRSDNGT